VAVGLLAAGLSLANFASAYLILPESLGAERRVARPEWGLGHLGVALARPEIRPLALVWTIVPIAFAGYTVALPFFAKAAFGWRERELGLLFTVIGTVAAVVQGYAFGRIVRRTGERALVIAGTFGMVLGIGIVPFLASPAQLYLGTVVLAFANSIMVPAGNGLVSTLAAAHEQGTMLGAVHAFAALGRFAGPEAIGAVHDAAGAPAAFFVAAGIMLVGAVISLWIARPTPVTATSPAVPLDR
jgi:DHA1 family tetracycline resistance protein-like MFS transporter